jgi:hypothetical protein
LVDTGHMRYHQMLQKDRCHQTLELLLYNKYIFLLFFG